MIPLKDSLLVPYSTNWYARTNANPNLFALSRPQVDAYLPLHNAYLADYNAMMAARADGTRSASLTSLKDTSKKSLLTYARELYAFVQVQPSSIVSDANKILIGVHVRAAGPTPVPAPTVRPGVDLVSVVGRTANVHIHDSASSTKRRKAPGAIAAWVYSFVGENYPTDPTNWQFHGAATKASFEVVFADSVPNGAQVWVCAAWVNRRGESGPVSVPITTNVQGGGASASSANIKIAA